jgi:DNA-binding CsgD family transcriptional regulator
VLIVAGDPGIGKTTLWDAGVDIARAEGYRVLAARASESEMQLSFVALSDLLAGIDLGDLAGVPLPQRRALEVALLRADPVGPAASSHAVAAGLLSALRVLARRRRLLVAVDDVQWLDAASSEALVFTARRLGDEGVSFLLSERAGARSPLAGALREPDQQVVEVGPLSLGAARAMLAARLGLTVPRPVLRWVVETGQGNPLFMLELGRVLVERGVPRLGEEVPVPESVEELLGVRVARLSPSWRRSLLALSLGGDLTVSQLSALTDAGSVESSIEAGVLICEGERVRASHPLLATAALRRAPERERRELHFALSRVVRGEQQALHRALAADREDSALAAQVATSGDDAFVRGARREALLLAEHALRLTPADAVERPLRVLAVADRLDDVGELRALTELLEGEYESLPAGPVRAHALLLLSDGESAATVDEQNRYLERALVECGEDANLRANLLAKKAANGAAGAVANLDEAEAAALAAVRDATEPRVLRGSLYALAWVRTLGGRPVDDLVARSRVAADQTSYISASPERVAGKRLMWRGDLPGARVLWRSLAVLADERGELTSYAMLRLHLCELELRAGDWSAAGMLLDEWAESSDYDAQIRPQYQRCRALLAAGRGDPQEAVRWANEAVDRARTVACRWDELEALRARAIAALLLGDAARAVHDLHAVWGHCERERIAEPAAFPVAPDLVEALVELDELDESREVTYRLEQLSIEQEHPWGLASTKRCQALIQLGSSYDEDTAELLEEAAASYAALGLRFDQARSWLLLGRVQRRFKKWAAARRSLEQAAALFDQIGSAGWCEQARGELARVGARRPVAEGHLTQTEDRIAQLAARGLSNKEIASQLFITVKTVERHLSHAYAKLHVRSRTQLAQRLASSGDLLKQ